MSGVSGSGGISASLYLGAGAMQAHSWGMAVSAHNVANVSTAGFTPQRALFATGPGGRGVTLDTVQREPPLGGMEASGATDPSDRYSADAYESAGLPPEALRPSGTELAREMPRMIVTQRTYEANAQTVRTADEMLGTLLNMKA